MIFEVGDTIPLSVSFTDSTPAPFDPTPGSVTLTIQAPDGSQTIIPSTSISQIDTGRYSYQFLIAQSGQYFFRWSGPGALNAVQESSLVVAATTLVPNPPPPPGTIAWTQASIDALDRAIQNGVTSVKFADRSFTYQSVDQMILARNVGIAVLSAGGSPPTANGSPRRQYRVETSSGW